MILHLPVLVSQTFILLPRIHPVPGQLTQAMSIVLELAVRQTGSLARQWSGQGYQSDVVTSEITV